MFPIFPRKSVAGRQHKPLRLSRLKNSFNQLFGKKKTQMYKHAHPVNGGFQPLVKLLQQIKAALSYEDLLYVKELLQVLGMLSHILCRLSVLIWVTIQLMALFFSL
jgi:hypothetical protein